MIGFLLEIVLNPWVLLIYTHVALLDLAIRAPATVTGTDAFKVYLRALLWGVQRPLDALRFIWQKIGAG